LPGFNNENPNATDAFVIKYDKDGIPLWSQQFGTLGAEVVTGAALDSNGNLFLAGTTTGALVPGREAGFTDAFVRKFTVNGVVSWTRQFGSTWFGSPVADSVTALVVDSSGNAYIGGTAEGAFDDTTSLGGADAFLRKFSPWGDVVWTRQFGSSCTDTLAAAAKAPFGVAVTGSTCGSLGSQRNAGGADVYVRLYDSEGNETWTRQFGTPLAEYSTGLASGQNGALYVSGVTSGALSSEPNNGFDDIFVAKVTDRPGQGPPGLRFSPVAPCRIMETRPEYNFEGRTGNFGPPFLRAGETRILQLGASSVCHIPALASAYALNVTVVPHSGLDFVTVWPGYEPMPSVWTVRSPGGQIVANSAIIKSGSGGTINVYASDDVDVIIDISGIFTEDSTTDLVYYPVKPCRVVETRIAYNSSPGPLGPPSLGPRETRRFQFPSSPNCSIPSGAAAYSVTLTAIPPHSLSFLTAWPSGGAQPNISNINSPSGRVLANSVIIPASPDGSIDVFSFDSTDLLIDINGYFARDDSQTGLFYFPITQCRASDSRSQDGPFGGPIFIDESRKTIPIPSSSCQGIPVGAKAYALTVTALPGGSPMPFLTLWPTGLAQPNASILNAFEGQTVSNSAIIPAGQGGSLDVYAFRRTHVVIDVSGYFAR
jgi:hypothetical protein